MTPKREFEVPQELMDNVSVNYDDVTSPSDIIETLKLSLSHGRATGRRRLYSLLVVWAKRTNRNALVFSIKDLEETKYLQDYSYRVIYSICNDFVKLKVLSRSLRNSKYFIVNEDIIVNSELAELVLNLRKKHGEI